MNTPHLVAALALSGACCSACASASPYEPLRTPRMRMLMTTDGLVPHRDGRRYTPQQVPGAFSCSETARRSAGESSRARKAAEDLNAAATVTDMFLPLVLGIALRLVASDHAADSEASLVDAINQHNDEPACLAQAAASTPEVAQ